MSNQIYKEAFLRDLKALLKRYDAEIWIENGSRWHDEPEFHVAGGGDLMGDESLIPYFDAVLPRCIKGDTEL